MESSGLTLAEPKVALSLEDLRQIQSIAASHLTFSLTLACPLRCAHCIVNAAPDLGRTTMPLEVAEDYAAQMVELAEYGIRSLSFTGGEPFVAARQIETMANAAEAAGITCGVVTAAPWARSLESARKHVERYRAIRCWDVSSDVYHEEFVGQESVRNAYLAVIEQGKRVTIRFTYKDPPTEKELRLLEFIQTLDKAHFSYQRVRAVGRGEQLDVAESRQYNPWVKPCLTQGLVVRYDGSISPCCLNLVEERRHPFQLGDARQRPLKQIHQAYMAMPLLQLIRTMGFAPIMDWIREAGLETRLPKDLPDEVYEVCSVVMKDKTIADFLVEKTSEPAMELRIAVVASRVLGEHQMLRAVLQRPENRANQCDDYGAARQWLAGIEQKGSPLI